MIWHHKATGSEVKSLGGFPVIYADPPWAYDVDKGLNGVAENHYRTMPLEEIKALPVGDLAAENTVLFMWGTYPLLRQMLDVGEAWGFTYKTIAFQWVKTYSEQTPKPVLSLGRWTRGNTEGCFLFVKGKPHRQETATGISQLIETCEPEILTSPRGRHSAKPAVVREKILQLMGDQPAIELFARQPAPGWECWGNEVSSTVELRP